jgi:hypothetical protein
VNPMGYYRKYTPTHVGVSFCMIDSAVLPGFVKLLVVRVFETHGGIN